MSDKIDVQLVGKELRKKSEKWFPEVHKPDAVVPLAVHYTVGLAGEVGEAANLIKKWSRYGLDSYHYPEELGAELADVFCYLLLLADELGLDLQEELVNKIATNIQRWG